MSFWRRVGRSGSKPTWWAIWAAWLKVGVSISSRYCWFWAAERAAISSTHSPIWEGLRPENREKVEKNWSWPLRLGMGTKLRREKASMRRS